MIRNILEGKGRRNVIMLELWDTRYNDIRSRVSSPENPLGRSDHQLHCQFEVGRPKVSTKTLECYV